MTLRGHASLRSKVRRMRRDLGDEVRDAVEMRAEQTADEARAQVQNSNQVWTGNLLSSIYMTKATFDGGSRYRIVADVPYAAFVEFGTGSRSDPSAPFRFQFDAPSHTPELTKEITEWVMTKPAFFGPRTEAVAWQIAKSISERGTHAHPYMRPAWFTMKPILVNDAEAAVSRVVRRL